MRDGHLTAEQVLEVLDIVQEQDAILIGGQCVNLWAEYYADASPTLAEWGPYTSKDIDFYRNMDAAHRLKHALDGAIRIPTSMDDATPNAATVVGSLGNARVEIDFLARVLGVKDASITNNYVTIQGMEQVTGRQIRVLLLSPADCLRSRLSNLNFLKRRDEIALNQGHAIIEIIKCFVADLLREGLLRLAQDTLLEMEHIIKRGHVGHPSHLEHKLRPETVMRHFLDHAGFDERWREKTLGRALDRTTRRIEAAEKRLSARLLPSAP